MIGTRGPARRPDVLVRRDPDRTLLVDPRSGATHLLNHTALAVWELCDGLTSPEEMVAAVCDLCGLPPAVVDDDITRVLGELRRADLLAG